MILTKNGNLMKFASGAAVNAHIIDPYNPLGLPAFTIRCKFSSGYTPTMGDSQTLVDASENVWDITKNSTSWNSLFSGNNSLLSILGANTTSVTRTDGMFQSCTNLTSVPLFDTSSCTYMSLMFSGCRSLTTVPLFDTSSCTNADSMFSRCSSLTTVPLFDTSSCTNMSSMFKYCIKIETGALALYQQASTQVNPPSSHDNTFLDCGRDTVTGAAELAQIPSDWGGTAS